MPSKLPSIRHRIARAVLVLSLLWGVIVTVVVSGVVNHEADEIMTQGLLESAQLVHSVLKTMPHENGKVVQPVYHNDYEEHLVWQVIDPDTQTVLIRSHEAPERPIALNEPSDQVRQRDDWVFYVFALDHADRTQIGGNHLLVAQSSAERTEVRNEVMKYTLLATLPLSLLSVLLLYVQLRRELKPLGELSRQVGRHDPLVPDTALPAPTRAELAPVHDAIHHLGQGLAQRINQARAFSAHAAHALRTPLAGIDTQLAVAVREAQPTLPALAQRLGRIRQGNQKLQAVAQSLLIMFRTGNTPKPQTFALADWLRLLPDPGLRTELLTPTDCLADPDLLLAVAMNLADNARDHGATVLTLRLDVTEDGWQHLHVADNGQGTDADTLARLREQLHRPDETSTQGLGLMLAASVMAAHGGRVELPDCREGFEVTLIWPKPALESPTD